MTVFQIVSLALMAGFYGVYLAKQLSQRKQGIRTNQMGRGNKERRTLTVERLLAAFSVLIVVVEVWSVVRGYSFLPQWCGWIGLVLTALGVVFFTAAVLQMRDSWRALITFLIASLGVHRTRLPFLRSPRAYHIYTLILSASVLFTYFGVNYLLGGMHSYA